MAWYWWVLGFLAIAVIGAWLEDREHGAKRNGRSQDGRAAGESGSEALCDVCGKPLDMAEATIVKPNEMRLIAYNGYGEVVTGAALPLSERRSKFQYLAYANDTDWALCRPCHDKARPYMAAANPGGMSQSEMDEVYDHGLKPFFDQ